MKFSLGFRVFIGFLIINLLYIIILIVAVIRLSDIGRKADVFSNIYLPLYKYVQRLESSRYLKFEELKKSMELKEKDEKLSAIEAYYLSFKSTNNELLVRIKGLLNLSEKVFIGSSEEKSYSQLQDRIKSLEQKSEQYNKAVEKLVESIKLGIYPGPIDYWVPVENAENILRKEQKILIMQVEGMMRLLIQKIESEESSIKWQLIFFTILAFVISVIVLFTIEKRVNRIVRFSSKLDSMILRRQFEPIRSANEDEISDLTNNINNLISEFLKIQRETEENRNQLLGLTANLRKLNQELEYIKSFNESIINSIKISIVVLNENLELIKFNPIAKSMFGIGEEILNRKFFEIFPSLSNEKIMGAVNTALFEKKMSFVEEQPLLLKNEQLILDIIVSPFVYERGEVKGIIMMIEDRTEITKTKRLLNQSERLATIGRMAAQLTHQIKNPLSTIALNIEFIRDDLLENKVEINEFVKKLNLIQSEIENLVKLSDEYLRFAKISHATIENIDINALLLMIGELYMLECKNKNINVDFKLSEKVNKVKGDYNQLKQAIVNIFVNAIESLTNGGVITVSTYNMEQFVVIDISDNGEGIDESVIKHIFDPFYSTKEGSSGLGLSIAAQIIEQMGGNISCKNNEDRGVLFSIKLPA